MATGTARSNVLAGSEGSGTIFTRSHVTEFQLRQGESIMIHSQPDDAPGRAETFTSSPGAQDAPGQPDGPTLYEFLTRLVTSPDAQAAFDADPRATLDHAGLGDMSATDVLQASSLVLDYAPVEIADEYGRSLQSSVEKFAASTQHVAINELHPAQPLEQEVTELSMLPPNDTPAPGSSIPAPDDAGDTNIDIEQNDSHNLINVHDVLSGNNVANGVGNVVGDTTSQATDTVDNTVNTVGDVTGDVTGVAGDVTGTVGDVTGTVGDVTGAVGDVTGVAGDLTGALPSGDAASADAGALSGVAGGALDTVGDVAGGVPVAGDIAGPAVDTVGGVAGGAVGTVEGVAGGAVDTVGGVAGGVVGGPVAGVTEALPAPADLPVVGDVAEQLPVDDVVSHLPAPSDLPVVGDIAGPAVEDVAGAATSALPLDGLL
ncbi:IniB N-terminal domain-containing protein [Saccharopolyspora gloriosae]|uniref:IniB N-terminal domain-containing protein n=1 Tax=Saccharopolyspora gloriosae TaxID=455344 RepID=UPI001FB57112|nr:IniB N-terminal domain-containing protein [Saccharopolyspora gloriosae]